MSILIHRFEFTARAALYALAALLPIWFVPASIGVEFGREATFTFLIAIAVIAWCLASLGAGELLLHRSLAGYAAFILLAVSLASALFSKAPYVSLFFSDATAEKFSSLLLGVALMMIAGSVLRTYQKAGTALLILLFSATAAAAATLVQILFGVSVFRAFGSFAARSDFNVIGTMNGLALFYAACFVIGMGMVCSPLQKKLRPWARYALYSGLAFFFLNVLLINFRTAWIGLALAGAAFFGLLFAQSRPSGHQEAAVRSFDVRHWAGIGLCVVSFTLVMVRVPLFGERMIAPEVSPAFSTTVDVARALYQGGTQVLLLGSGPATFGLDWARFHNSALNTTLFWDTRFGQGFSWFATLLATTGILGALVFFVFIAVFMAVSLRALLWLRTEESPFAMSIFLGALVIAVDIFLYPANFSLAIVFFFLAGMIMPLIRIPLPNLSLLEAKSSGGQEEADDGIALVDYFGSGREESGMIGMGVMHTTDHNVGGGLGVWNVEELVIKFEKPLVMFCTSLVLIAVITGAIAAIYYRINEVRAAFVQTRALEAVRNEDVDGALVAFEKALALNGTNYRIAHLAAQMHVEQVRRIIARAAAGQNVQQEFQAAVSAARQSTERAIRLNPEEPLLWRTQASLYEILIPFIDGAEKFADINYAKVVELDPVHPAFLTERARARMVFADRIQQKAAGAGDEERKDKERVWGEALQSALEALDRAIVLKPDFAFAHYLRAQVALRAGNIAEAITSTTHARTTAPQDVGIAFQLGLLHYQAGNFAEAQNEFERAVSLNPHYSNARYFLGLIHDRNGRRDRALDEFGRIEALNPDNGEVKHILENLRANRPALDGIVPPAPLPEKRKEAPVE